MVKQIIRAASVQFNHKPGDKEYNVSRIEDFIQEAAEEKVQILTFPEMCITGYWHVRNLSKEHVAELAEDVPGGESTTRLSGLAKEHNMIIGAGLIEKTKDGKLYNSFVVSQPDGSIHCHRKIHAFISEHVSSGNSYTIIDTELGVKLGVLICYDNNIIENARITALKGADILLAPHQTGGVGSKSPYAMGLIDPELWHNRKNNPDAIKKEFRGDKGRGWLMRWLPSRAHDNGMFICFSNGVGYDDGEVRTGNAMIIDPYGRILNETSKPDDDMVIADLDINLLPECSGRRWMRGRKPELYEEITHITGDELDSRKARFS
ncbi:nitrilase family protein [Bacteroidota bacterium]